MVEMVDQQVVMDQQAEVMVAQLAVAIVIILMAEQQITTLTFNSRVPLLQNNNLT